jgi:pimeloyl-ACP methyl ester carboxylesterase
MFRVVSWSDLYRPGGLPLKNRLITIAIFIFTLGIFSYAQTPKSHWAKLDKSMIHYYDIGGSKSKNALVFIHGWTCSANFWKDNYNAFPGYRVIALDLIGHGQSDRPKAEYSMEYFAKSVEAVLKKAKIDEAVLVGHSMGTPVARQFYRLYPDQVLGLVIVDGPLRPFAPKAMMESFIAPMRTNYKEAGTKMIDGMLKPVKEEAEKKFIRDAMLATPDYVAVSAMDGMADDKIWGDDKINVPVLAIMAAGGMAANSKTEENYRGIASDLDFQVWADVSHFIMMDAPARFNLMLKGFIDRKKLL